MFALSKTESKGEGRRSTSGYLATNADSVMLTSRTLAQSQLTVKQASRAMLIARCTEDTVECVIRPRANAAIVADDLRW